MIHKIKSYILVIIQFACLAILVFSAPFIIFKPLVICFAAISILILILSIFAMRISKITVFPTLKEGAVFVGRGPYRLIRHPMYLSVILFSFGLWLERMTAFRTIILLLLIIDLLIKIEFEESILIKEFNEYAGYKDRTKKLLPFIY